MSGEVTMNVDGPKRRTIEAKAGDAVVILRKDGDVETFVALDKDLLAENMVAALAVHRALQDWEWRSKLVAKMKEKLVAEGGGLIENDNRGLKEIVK